MDWQDEQFGALTPQRFPCPWQKMGPIAHLEIEGMCFHVPREFLRSGSNEPDGPATRMLLAYVFPEMTPYTYANRQKDIHNTVDILISSVSMKCSNKQNCDLVQQKYKCLTGDNTGKQEIIPEYYDEKVKLYKYRIDRTNSLNQKFVYDAVLFTNDDVNRSEYYLSCQRDETEVATENCGAYPTCASMFLYKNKLLVEYRFSRKFLPSHLQIRQNIVNLLDQYNQPQKKE